MAAKKLQTASRDELKFEEALAEMEKIVEKMEAGELPLEESLAAFSEGIRLSALCLAKLSVAEEAINKIIHQEQGQIVERNLVLKGDD